MNREAIVSGGTINSPQLLLLSGIGPKDELDKVGIEQVHDLPGVGQNLHNHVSFGMNFNLNLVKNTNDLDWLAALNYFTHRTGPLTYTGISEVAARLTTKYGDPAGDDPDLQLVFEGLSATCCRTCSVGELADPDNPDSRKSIRITSDNIKPKSRGYIGLHTSNPLDAPLMQPNYLAEADDVKILIEGIRVIQSLGNTTVLREKYGTELIKENYGDCEEQYT